MDLELVKWRQVAQGACHTSRNDDHSMKHIENTYWETDGIGVDPLATHNVTRVCEHEKESESEQQPRTPPIVETVLLPERVARTFRLNTNQRTNGREGCDDDGD